MSALRQRVIPAAAGTAMAALLAAGAWYGYDYATSQPIRRVVFVGDPGRISRADLDAFALAIEGAPSGSASLAAVREAARRIPWVRDAAVRRRFPDAIEVSFETHEVVARWAEGGLVSTRGDLFNGDHAGFLPLFRGPAAAAPRMAQDYPAISRAAGAARRRDRRDARDAARRMAGHSRFGPSRSSSGARTSCRAWSASPPPTRACRRRARRQARRPSLQQRLRHEDPGEGQMIATRARDKRATSWWRSISAPRRS
jgi:hypothetical protein